MTLAPLLPEDKPLSTTGPFHDRRPARQPPRLYMIAPRRSANLTASFPRDPRLHCMNQPWLTTSGERQRRYSESAYHSIKTYRSVEEVAERGTLDRLINPTGTGLRVNQSNHAGRDVRCRHLHARHAAAT